MSVISKELDEDQIEIQANSVRSAISELVNMCVYSLNEAFASQDKIRKNITNLEQLLNSITHMPDAPNFQSGIENINRLKARVGELQKRIHALDARFSDLEKNIVQ
ncbi:hypothetical protein TVAG_288510 [Trichomonas vaginalis G3]|uniref:Biogenesis of lysosome-related organelles complex 1 subunit 7 n=1 Tax=Trichomonas vaginalis (strain ATCC PRA-98 / G3) TaxID=412133 RepID=A2FEB1_TRIV3|nr:hypothetical protein TVAGG3_0545780 [Trichomonas vaginalis G3]EAX96751.1 hypothetical protein TVAG_288510 [Trichomonas vaginalis G3]KAI5520168.1 hypothetical protein TVAGG3_0545780 [Trichomonas vaginalis G3]|eukprot:XP_001309681.1 hypothetical protein [Trichomonas vaginalis G3]